MKQLSIFDKEFKKLEKCGTGTRRYWKLFTDGASRNNPGPSGAGIVLFENDEPVEERGFFLGNKTNNQAEYFALLLGIFYLKRHLCHGDLVLMILDSQLIVRQLQGKYKVKNRELKPMYQLVKTLLDGVNYTVMHVLRDENKRADELANKGLDKKYKPPQKFLNLLQKYEISI